MSLHPAKPELRLFLLLTASFAATCRLARSQDDAVGASRPAVSPKADDQSDVALVRGLYDQAREALAAGDPEGAAALTAKAEAERGRRLRGIDADVVDAVERLGADLYAAGRSAAALPLLASVRTMRDGQRGGDDSDVARGLNNYAGCLVALGRTSEALPEFSAALAMFKGMHRGDHPDVAACVNNVAYCLDELGRASEALPLYEAALAMRERLFDGDHPDTASSLNNVAACLNGLGRSAEALPRYEASIAMRRRLFKGDHPLKASGDNNLACCLRALGRSAEALPLHESARAMRERLHRGDHPETAGSLKDVASCLQDLGRSAEALPLLEAARAMRERLHQGDHPETADSRNEVAACLKELGRAAEALPHFEAASTMFRRLYPGDHPSVATSLNNVAFCLQALGRPAEALSQFAAARDMHARLFHGDNPSVASCEDNVATCLMALGRSEEALRRHEAAYAMRGRLFTGDHPSVALSLNNVASCLWALGRPAEALARFEAASAMFRRLYEGDHPNLAPVLLGVAGCLAELDRPEEARSALEAALDVARRGRLPALTRILRDLARSESARGGTARAATLLNEAAEEYEARRPDVMRLADGERGAYESVLRGRAVYDELADAYLRLGDTERALAALERGRGRAALDLMARSRVDPMTQARNRAEAAGDAPRVAEIAAAIATVAAREGELARCRRAHDAVAARPGSDDLASGAELKRLASATTAARAALRAAEAVRARLLADVAPLGVPATIGAARTLITGKERLLAYAVGEASSRVFVLRPADGEVVVRELKWPEGGSVSAKSLGEAVVAFRNAITSEGRVAAVRGVEVASAPVSTASAPVSALGRRLFAAVMPADLWPEIRDAGRVELMADGALHLLPFEALLVSDGPSVADRRYWLDAGPQVVYAASASVSLESRRLRDARRTTPTRYAILSAGDPNFELGAVAAPLPSPPENGVLVVRVPDGSNGAAAGLRRGDVITAYGGNAVVDAKQLLEAMNAAALAAEDAPGTSTVALTIWRVDGATRVEAPPGRLGVYMAKGPLPTAWAALIGEDEAALSVVERGGIGGRRGGLSPLPGTRREVEAIARTVEGLHDPLRGKLSVKTLLGAEATVTRVFAEAPKARILHFATHYLAEETDEASFSALALTAPAHPNRDDDGFLRIRDVIERWRDRLSATELVVLSACESKGSRGSNDDGIYAMPIALLYAGVPSVVSSLWRVEDQSTADLMSDFYRRLFDPAANAATSDRPAPTRLEHFTAARKAARARRPEPYFWAPFVWMGDPR